MGQMTSQQAQAIDPILSNHARGYTNDEFIGTQLLPYVDIANRSMKVIRFGKDSFRSFIDTRRAPGSQTRRLQFGYTTDPVSLRQESLEAQVAYEVRDEAIQLPGIDLAKTSIENVQYTIGLGREVEIANMVRDPANYKPNNQTAFTGTDKWSDPASKPKDDIKEAKEAVRRMIGRYPNVLVLGPSAFNALDDHPAITEKFKYTSSDSITSEMLAKYFNVEKVLIGKAVALAENASDNDPAGDVWGNDAVLAYVPKGANYMVPAFGYTYRLKGYPIVEQPYEDRNYKSWIYPYTEEYRPYITGAEGGFLFKDVAEG